MGKNRKSFRETWEDDEWGSNEERSTRRKEKKKKQRQEERKAKFSDRWYDEDFNLKREK